ncbi:hypothetical protein LXA43DRAFT_185091 [Ganoderma leucocontextum]|nr:hypothetical protein LXA43DRAFT_185091 [Ganoderma leucocontextum]
MLAASSIPATNTGVQHQHAGETDPFVKYARSLHDYTLRLWTESRRIAEEKARLKAAASASGTQNPSAVRPPQKREESGTVKP